MEDICVVGLGAVGVVYAYILEASKKARVTAVCRSNLSLLSGPGIRIASDALGIDIPAWKPYRAVATPAEAADREYRYVVCCFKALPDVITTPDLIRPLLAKSHAFVLIQNGIGIELDLQRAVPHATIISGCAYIDSTAVDGGKTIRQTNKSYLVLGAHGSTSGVTNDRADEAFAALVDLFRQGGGVIDVALHIDAARWRKVLWNATFSTICTMSRVSVADVLRSDMLAHTKPAIEGLMTEVLAVAHAAGVAPDELGQADADDTLERSLELYGDHLERTPSAFRPSMLVDLDHGRPIEVEVIVGGIVRQARALDVPTPRLDVVYGTLKAIQGDLIRRGSATA